MEECNEITIQDQIIWQKYMSQASDNSQLWITKLQSSPIPPSRKASRLMFTRFLRQTGSSNGGKIFYLFLAGTARSQEEREDSNCFYSRAQSNDRKAPQRISTNPQDYSSLTEGYCPSHSNRGRKNSSNKQSHKFDKAKSLKENDNIAVLNQLLVSHKHQIFPWDKR